MSSDYPIYRLVVLALFPFLPFLQLSSTWILSFPASALNGAYLKPSPQRLAINLLLLPISPPLFRRSTSIPPPLSKPTPPPTTPTTMAPRKPRCNFKECKEAAQRIVGDCSFCAGHFCSKHRMLEAHSCTGLEDCKKESHARNADKLNSERTVVVKGV